MNSSIPPRSPSARTYTPDQVKTMLLFILLRDGVGTLKGIPSTVLTNFSMYDPSMTTAFAAAISLGEDEDLHSVVEKATIETARLDQIRQYVRYCMTNPEAEDMKRSVDSLLDEDIMERGLSKNDPDIFKRTTYSKAGLIVADDERKRFGIEVQDDGHDFRIKFMTLVDGWGQASQVEILYFKYKTSFPEFLATLKDATRSSKIPPEKVTMPGLNWPFATYEEEEVERHNETSNTTSNTQNANLPEPGANNNGISSENITSTQNRSSTDRDPNDKGYNLSDGPWMYRLPHIGKVDAPKPTWQCIRDERDYMIMMDGIKTVNYKYKVWGGKSKCSFTIMHSMDRDCQQRHFDIREEERAFSAEWENELQEAGFFDDEDAVGKPGDDWFDYRSRINTTPPITKE